MTAGGQISGTPTTAGAFAFNVVAADTAGRTGTRSFTITILDAGSASRPAVSSGSLGPHRIVASGS